MQLLNFVCTIYESITTTLNKHYVAVGLSARIYAEVNGIFTQLSSK